MRLYIYLTDYYCYRVIDLSCGIKKSLNVKLLDIWHVLEPIYLPNLVPE